MLQGKEELKKKVRKKRNTCVTGHRNQLERASTGQIWRNPST